MSSCQVLGWESKVCKFTCTLVIQFAILLLQFDLEFAVYLLFRNTMRFVRLSFLWLAALTCCAVAELGDIPPDHWSLSPKYRLPTSVRPVHYDLHIIPILDTPVTGHEPFTAPGRLSIEVECLEATDNITFHSSPIVTIDQATVLVQDAETNASIPVVGFETNDILDFFVIRLGAPGLQAGRPYRVQMHFVAPVSTNLLNGLYLTRYTKPATNETGYAAATQFQMFSFRQMSPGFDEPALKATFNISIGRWPDKYHTLCSTTLGSTNPVEIPGFDGWVWDNYERTVRMSPYLIAFIVSEFEFSEASPDLYPLPVRVYGVPHEIQNGDGQYAADTAAVQTAFLDQFYEINYSIGIPKMDIAAVPDFLYGAMENWGLITFTPRLLLHTANVSTEQERGGISHTLAHEIGHWLFGNLVTCAWWNDIWLQEGLTTYASVHMWQHSQPEFEPLRWFHVDAFQNSLRTEEVGTSVGKELQNNGSAKIIDNFNDVTARKGAVLVRMMDGFLGRETVRKGIARYLRALSFDSGTQANFFTFITEQAEEDGRTLPDGLTVNQIMYTYTYNRGLPILYVYNVAGDGGNLHIRQQHYRGMDSTQEDSSGWWIPVTIATQDRPDFDTDLPAIWLRPNQTEATLPVNDLGKWIVVNPGGRGYYRVVYNQDLAQMLQNVLQVAHTIISPESRSQLLDDHLMAAFQNGTDHNDIETALGFTRYLEKESDRIVWETVIINLRTTFNLLQGTPGFPEFKKYFVPRLLSALTLIGFRQEPHHKGANTILRAMLLDWVCKLDTDECNEYTRDLLEPWKLDPENYVIPPDVLAAISCNAIANGTQADVDFIFGRYVAATHSGPKGRLLTALGCSRDTTILQSLLAEVFSSDTRFAPADRVTAVQRIAANYLARSITLSFINGNLVRVLETVGTSGVASIVNTLSQTMSTEEELVEVTTFINDNEGALDSIAGTLRAYLRNIEKNIAWRAAYEARLAFWFNRN